MTNTSLIIFYFIDIKCREPRELYYYIQLALNYKKSSLGHLPVCFTIYYCSPGASFRSCFPLALCNILSIVRNRSVMAFFSALIIPNVFEQQFFSTLSYWFYIKPILDEPNKTIWRSVLEKRQLDTVSWSSTPVLYTRDLFFWKYSTKSDYNRSLLSS